MSNLSRKLVAVLLTGAILLFTGGAVLEASASSLTPQQIQSILSMLQAFGADQRTIANVQAALTGQPVSGGQSQGGGSQASTAYTFTKDLTLGSRGPDVKALQQFLNSKGYVVARSGAGSPGNESEYFGPATRAALIKFQKDNNITPAFGYFGPKTRAVVNSMVSSGVSGSTGGGVILPAGFNVSLAANTPNAGSVVAGQIVADLASFTFSNGTPNPVTVNSLTVTRIGVSSDNSLLNVYLYQGSNRLTDGASVVNNKVTFTNSSGLFVVPANSTVTVTVKADIDSSAQSGQTVGFAIMSASDVLTQGNVEVKGQFPLNGNLMTVASVNDLLTVTIPGGNSSVNGAGATINAGTVNAIVWSAPLSVSQRPAYLKYVKFRQVGSVQQDALQNIALYIDGSKVANSSMQSDGTVAFDMNSNPVVLNTGAHTMELHADIVKGSSRTFSFSIQVPSDIVIVDSNYGVAVKLTGVGVSFPISASQQTTINAGFVSITTDPSFTANETLSQASNVTLGQWVAKAYGEDVRVGQLGVKLELTGTTTAENYINNIALYVNGAQVGSSQNWHVGSATNTSTTRYFGSGNLFTMEAGKNYVIAVKGDTYLGASTTTILATLIQPVNQLQGLTSYNTFPTSIQSHAGQSLSLTTSSLTLAANPQFSNKTIGSNVSKEKIGSYVLTASNVDGIQVTQITVNLSTNPNNLLQNLSNLYISENTQPVYPQSQNVFSVNFTIPAGQSKILDVFADIGNATGTVTTSISVVARAVTSQTQVNPQPATGQLITVGQGTLGAPTLVQSESLQSQYVIGGTSGQRLAVYNFVSTGGSANITELSFRAVSGTSSPTITGVTVEGRSGVLTYNNATGTVTISGLNISVPGNDYAGVNVPVTVTYVPVGANGSKSGVTTTLALTSVKYTSGGKTITTYTNVSANTVMLVGAAPTISVSNTSVSGLVAGQNKLFEFTVGAKGGTIAVGTTTFNISASGIATATVTSPQLYVGNSPLAGSSCNTAATTTGWIVTCVFPSDYRISGSGQTFALYANVSGTFGNSGQSSVTTQLGAANTFSWSDVSGSEAPHKTYKDENYTYLYNYPTATWSVRN